MLHEFLTANRDEIIARSRAKVAQRAAPRPTEVELQNGVPLFLNQLIEALRVSGASNEEEIGKSATQHGHDLLRMGFTVAQVVHDYGDVCQVVTELAVNRKAPITTEEFHTFNRCLDDAMAQAVTAHARHREQSIADEGTERAGVLAHELRNLVFAAMMAFNILKKGSVGIGGSTGAVLGRSLKGLRDLIDRALTEVRLEAGIQNRERIAMPEFIEELEATAAIEANDRDLLLTVMPVENGVAVEADRQVLASAVANLLQNAFKFTRPHGHVWLKTHATADRVLIEIEDQCGGLPQGKSEELFSAFSQGAPASRIARKPHAIGSRPDRTGMGLGLSISRRGVEANGGEVHVRDLPGVGCVFTIDLPREPPPPL